MEFTYISLQRVLKILAALRAVSDDLSKCCLTRSKISEDVLVRHVPSSVLTLAVTNEMASMIQRRRFAGMNGQTEYWFLTAYGEAFLADPSKPPRTKAEPVVYTEPEDAKKLRLARGKRETRRRRHEAAILRNRRKGVDYSQSYNEIIEDESYSSRELQSLPVAQRIAILRSRCGTNQLIQKYRGRCPRRRWSLLWGGRQGQIGSPLHACQSAEPHAARVIIGLEFSMRRFGGRRSAAARSKPIAK